MPRYSSFLTPCSSIDDGTNFIVSTLLLDILTIAEFVALSAMSCIPS
jgi:hypothetical protein